MPILIVCFLISYIERRKLALAVVRSLSPPDYAFAAGILFLDWAILVRLHELACTTVRGPDRGPVFFSKCLQILVVKINQIK